MLYDVAIIGAGPAGVMAAYTAADNGLRVILIDKFSDISRINRACCQQFVMDENYENENIRVANGKVIFPNNGFEVDYPGIALPITDTYFLSPQGRKVHFSYPDKHPIAIKFNKGVLLKTLLEKCEYKGVEFLNNTLAYSMQDTGDAVEVHAVHNGKQSVIKAKKLVAADGVNSRIAETIGMNRQRIHFATAFCIIYSLCGVEDFESTAMKWHMGRAYFSNGPVILDPSLEGPHIADLVVMGSKHEPPEQIFKNFTTKGPLAYMFAKAKVVGRTGCTVKAYNSMLTPHKGNSLIIGDAAAYVEVEVQGALMCGFHAGNAVCNELMDRGGFKQYTQWWQRSFEFNSEEALRVAQGYALVPTYTDDEIDYLFGLVEDVILDGAYGQYKAPRLLWDAILLHKEKIAQENPEVYRKITNNAQLTLADAFRV